MVRGVSNRFGTLWWRQEKRTNQQRGAVMRNSVLGMIYCCPVGMLLAAPSTLLFPSRLVSWGGGGVNVTQIIVFSILHVSDLVWTFIPLRT